jgi:putative ABC transport system permease protein
MKNVPQPPRWADQLLAWYCAPHLLEEIQGDLHEEFYYQVQRVGLRRARFHYVRNVLGFVRPFALQRKKNTYSSPSFLSNAMLENYLKMAWRNLWKNKPATLMNAMGLSVGMTATVLLLLWGQDELGYNQFHRNAPNTYRAVANFQTDGTAQHFSTTPPALASQALSSVPGIRQAVRITRNGSVTLFRVGNKSFVEKNCAFVDPAFFTVFDFPLLQGSASQPFTDNRSVIITQRTARKYFGDAPALGRTIQVDARDNYVVSGVAADIPSNSDIQYDFFFPFSILNEFYRNTILADKGYDGDWMSYDYDTYFHLDARTAPAVVAAKLAAVHKRNWSDEMTKTLTYSLQPLGQLHLYNPDGSEGAMQTVRILIAVGIAILLIACFNYVNLVTARATARAAEVGVRKIVGANRRHLFGQFFCESTLLFGLALLLTVGLVYLLLPYYNQLSGKRQTFNPFEPDTAALLALLLGGMLLVAGVYPALLLSSFGPLQSLKGKIMPGRSAASLRKLLVSAQFVVSIVLMTGTVIMGRQMAFIGQKNLGYDKENVFRFDMRDMRGHYETVKDELLRQPGVAGVTGLWSGNLMELWTNTTQNDWDGKAADNTFRVTQLAIERNFLPMLGMKLVQGEGFTGTPADSARFILNETAVREMGLKDPVGKRFSLQGRDGVIAGVVADFHFKKMQQKIEPMVLFWGPQSIKQICVKTTGRDATKAIAAAEKLWKRYNPDIPFEYSFLDQEFDKLYQSEHRTGRIFQLMAGIAIFISCLGLFGLATYVAETRRKEIGIRKVLGASVLGILTLLSGHFLKLVAVAFLVAVPIAWYGMEGWLAGFAYRIPVEAAVFVVTGTATVVITLLTVGIQALKAALMNPVKSLRNE